jgi:8-oxo-dGTP pyrophosphatase MutT (NUDIX family)
VAGAGAVIGCHPRLCQLVSGAAGSGGGAGAARRARRAHGTAHAARLRSHAGQVSFPGGRIESADGSPRAAALREAREEIGLEERFVSVSGYLPDHIVMTGFRVTPVVAFVKPGFSLTPDLREVQDTFEVPLDYVFDFSNYRVRRRRSGFTGEEVEFYDLPFAGRDIWGATAGILMTLYRLCVGPFPHD